MRQFADDKQKKPAEAKPAEPPAKSPEEKTPVPTAEQLEARAKEVVAGMFPAPGPKKAEPKKEEPKPEPEPAEPEPAAQPPEKPTVAKKPLPPPIAEAVKPEQLQAPTPKPEPKAAPANDFTEEDEETIAALARMEKDGKAQRGIVDRTKRFWADESAYIAEWQKNNPGETFDADSEAHSEFYDKNEPKYDEQEFKRAAKINLKEQSKREIKEELKRETETEAYQREMREQAPRTAAAVEGAIKDMVSDAGFKDLMTKDGKTVLTKEIEEEIDKANPHARSILMDEAQLLAAQVAEIDKFERFPGKYQIDQNFSVKVANGAYVQPHRMLMDFAVGLESEIAALPPEETARDGKRFVTQGEFTAQVDRIMSSNGAPEAKARAFDKLSAHYYTLGWEDIRLALITKHSTQARTKIERFGGTKTATAVPEPAKTATASKPAAPTEPRGPTKAPSVSSASDNTDTTKKGSVQSGKTADQVVQSMWG